MIKRMRIPLLAVTILLMSVGPATAGRNINGAMIVHTNDSYDYSPGGVCTAPEGDPRTCVDANTMASRSTGQVIWLLAAFPDDSDPCVSVIYFGIDYDDANLDPGAGTTVCGPAGSFEIPDDGWPYSGRGNSIAFVSPVCHDTLFPFYAFQVDGGVDGTSYFCSDVNPTGGYGAFVDDSSPPVLDYCYLYGCVRWGAPGSNECPGFSEIPGACCYLDGSCEIATAEECLTAGGVYLGDNEPCVPDPCPDPGACCYADGRCEFVLPGDCQGTFEQGPCDPNPCPQPGACCQPHWCNYVMEDQCYADFYPHTPCDPNPCLTPGACCFPDGHCEYLGDADCHTGVFYPEVPCDPNPCPQPVLGACCYPDGHCEALMDYQCGTGDFRAEVACDPNPCPQPGACCTLDSCYYLMADECSDTFFPHTPCDPNPCWPSGACCYPDGHCEVLLQGECYTGVFYPDVACDPNPCPPPVYGACCYPDGHCEYTPGYACGTGVFYPEVACDPNPCPPPVSGACCYPNGLCEYMVDYQCGTGVFYPEVACDPNPCPQPEYGACCYPDGHCEFMLDYECGTGLFYQGVACDPNPCPQVPYGACCFPDGHCEYVSQDQCGGAFYPNYDCDPNPCPSDCVHDGLVATGRPRIVLEPGKPGPIAFSPKRGNSHRIDGSRDICWSEPPDLNGNKITSEIISDFGLASEVANDFMIATYATITQAIAYGGMYNWAGEPNMTFFNLYFYDDQGCVPGFPFQCYLSVAPWQTFIGYDGYGYPTYKLNLDVSVDVMGNTTYWFGFQASNHAFPPQWGRQGTGGVVTGCDAVFKSTYFGYPYWTPLVDIVGSPDDSAQEFECGGATPVKKTTWGAIKALYR